jgi:uncharacterized protein YpuA (DUF1002 family)
MKKNQKQALEIGAGLAAVAAVAAGVYMMTGKNAKNRKKVAKWVGNLQTDVVRELDKAGNVTKATYNKVVDATAKNYKGLKDVSAVELASVAADLKSNWDRINAELSNASQSVRRVVPKRTAVKKAPAKKAAPKRAAAPAAKKTAAKKAAPKRAAAKKR